MNFWVFEKYPFPEKKVIGSNNIRHAWQHFSRKLYTSPISAAVWIMDTLD